jgi:hypothetical protein
MSIRESIMNSIIKLQCKKTKEVIPILKKELIFERSKYSSSKDIIWHLYINSIKIRKSSDFIITYVCNECKSENIVGTTQLLRKIRKGICRCSGCSLTELNSCEGHNIVNMNKEVKKEIISKEEFHENSVNEFEAYDDMYKNSYLLSHLTEEDYNRIRKNIISFGNNKFTDLNNYVFWSIYKVNNQMRFSSVLYDKINKTIFKAHQPIMFCDNCEKQWRCKSLESFKNDLKILCQQCKLCNRTFKIRPTKNINNQTILYQSKLELKFIEWCNNNNIVVTNGPNIDYLFNGKNRKYKIDFQVDNILIETKDFHIWHKNQVESGMWQKKIDAVNDYIKEMKLDRYFFITPNNWNQMMKELINCLNKKIKLN